MIKGHYIATIVIDANIPEDAVDSKKFDELKEAFENMEEAIKDRIEDDFFCHSPMFEVAVNKRYSHLYKSEDKA